MFALPGTDYFIQAMLPSPRLPALLNSGGPATPMPQVIQLGAPHFATGNNFDAFNDWGMNWEGPLHTYSRCDAPHRKGLSQATTLAGNYWPFKNLNAFTVAFPYTHVNTDGVTGIKIRNIVS